MARFPYLNATDLPEDQRELLVRPINLNRQLVHSPEALRHFGQLGHWIRYGSRLDPRLRELAILQVGYLARSPYEYSHHLKIGQDFGVSKADIAALIAETEGGSSEVGELGELERMVLRGAREITEDTAMADETFAMLSSRLSPEEMVDLVVTISFYCAVVRVLATLEIDVEPEYASYLEEFPLPK